MKDDICKTSEVVEEALKNSNGKWADAEIDQFGYGQYEVKKISKKVALKYGIQEPADIDLLIWKKE